MQAAIAALSSASRSSSDAIAAVARNVPDDAPLPVVLADLDALLALIYHTATKLALALKPVSPSYPAVVPLLSDLALHIPALAHCARLLHDDRHGATLSNNVRSHTKDILVALRALIQTFLNNAARGPRLVAAAPAPEEYLLRTSTLHDLITTARGPSGIPKDNQAAVYRAWMSDKESLEDNLREIAGMISVAQSDSPSSHADDGWDDIGLGHSTSMDEHELARANNVHQLLRLTTLLHKRIFLDLLAHPSPAPVTAFDALLVLSNRLLSTSDDLVSALYTPHDTAYIRAQVLELANIATTIQSQLPAFLPATDDFTNQLRALTVDGGTPAPAPPSEKKADRRWFDTCIDQIRRLSSAATESEHMSS